MSKPDPLQQHRETMRELHATFQKKAQYHRQKAYLELKDIYWLIHEFFNTFLGKETGKEVHFTEEEIGTELLAFRHEFLSLTPETIAAWKQFLEALSHAQYSGIERNQQELHQFLDHFLALVNQTLGPAEAPVDEFTKEIGKIHVFVTHGDHDKALAAYEKLVHEYEKLSPEKKRVHYTQLELLYKAIVALRSA